MLNHKAMAMCDGGKVVVFGGNFRHESDTYSPSASPSAIPGFERLLQATSPSAFHNSGARFDPPRCHPNARLRVIKEINDWIDGADGSNQPIMWVNGDAGIGKSAIAQTVAEHLAEEGRLLASFFFSRADPSRNDATRLVASIAYHAALHIPRIKEHIICAVDRNPLLFELSPSVQFSALIVEPICDLAQSGYFSSPTSPRVIILDGIDECNDSRAQVLILNVIAAALQKGLLPLLFLISSRREEHLSIPFTSTPIQDLHVGLRLDELFRLDDATTEIQIINPEQDFLSGFGDRIIEWGMGNIGSEYEVVAIVGSQSSGKSTLLNSLFGTNFVVMDPSSRGRTTNSIWVSRDKDQNVIVMDVEGSDSASRGDDQEFERKTALFALACSRLLIVNIWENQVGLYNGANMGLLKIVFEEHLSLYGTLDTRIYHRPRLLFVLQAHTSGTSLASLARTLTRDLNRVWESVEKPEGRRGRSLQDHFDFEFASLPHIQLTSHYNSQVELLRKRFVEKDAPNYLLKGANSNLVPTDGLELYMKTIWEAIRTNENLNLPGQHELLAQAMCDKISTSLLAECRPRILSQLAILDEGTVIDDLGSLMLNWRSEILAHYDEQARRYMQSIYAEKRADLICSYHDETSRLFTTQLRNLRQSLLDTFDVVLADAVVKNDTEFTAITSDTKREYENRFVGTARNTAITDSGWDWEGNFQELQSGLLRGIQTCDRERKVSLPLQAVKSGSVGHRKSMTTKATLYRDGKLLLEVNTHCNDKIYGLFGRVLVVVRDEHGNAVAVTNELRCTTRGSRWDPTTSSSGLDIFSLQFPGDIRRRAAGLDIYQTDQDSLAGVLHNILQVGGAVIAA